MIKCSASICNRDFFGCEVTMSINQQTCRFGPLHYNLAFVTTSPTEEYKQCKGNSLFILGWKTLLGSRPLPNRVGSLEPISIHGVSSGPLFDQLTVLLLNCAENKLHLVMVGHFLQRPQMGGKGIENCTYRNVYRFV